jgi:CMP/dCMP kinase
MPDRQAGITVAISRQKGSGGAYVGRCLADRLGLRYVDRDLLRNAAEYLHESDRGQRAAAEAESSWWAKLGSACAFGGPDGLYVPPSATAVYDGEVFRIESRLIQEIVDGHVAVIAGRGAAQVLRGRPAVATVFVHAPEEWRVARVQQVYGIADRKAAARAVKESDEERARFIRRLAGIEWTDARYYDLAVNTAALGFETAVDVIERTVMGRLTSAGRFAAT